VVLNNKETPSEFSTKLSVPLDLNDSWKVGLTEITFSHHPINFSYNDFLICKSFGKEKTNQRISLHSTTITTGQKLVEIINDRLREIKEFPAIQFQFDELTQKTSLRLEKNKGVQFSKRLASIFSFDEQLKNTSEAILTKYSKYCTNVRLHFWNIYIYSNLTEPIILGEKLYPLLQTLPIENFGENYFSKTFNPPLLMPLSLYYIPEIEIKVCDELGTPLKFRSGCSVICKLLFKK